MLSVDLIFKIGLAIIVSVLHSVLKQAGKEVRVAGHSYRHSHSAYVGYGIDRRLLRRSTFHIPVAMRCFRWTSSR